MLGVHVHSRLRLNVSPLPPSPTHRRHKVILLSAVRSNHAGRVGFLADWRRLNVAITRARRGVVVVGDPNTLRRDPHWRAFMQWCDKHGAVMDESTLLGKGEGNGKGGSNGK